MSEWCKFQNGWCRGCGKSEHVHQLQNIYYALTGTELELKEETIKQ